jgi:GT2 family glycosyltransferase
MIAVIVINYRQVTMTIECLTSLYAHAGAPFHLFVIDNAADTASDAALKDFSAHHANITHIRNDDNLGFAGACNQALKLISADPRFDVVALLNNDTLVDPNWLAHMARRLDRDQHMAMVAGRMMDFQHPDRIDSLGIIFYKTGIASNRKDPAEPLLGPCGGAALYTMELLNSVAAVTGYMFDPDFFCYAEDTDLALRARALGFACAFADDAVVRHRGSASSGGGFNEFVAYQGLRNSLFALIKNLPTKFLVFHLGWLLTMQLAIVIKYLIKGHPRLLWRIYRDFVRGLPRTLRQRHAIQSHSSKKHNYWVEFVSQRFYDPAYIAQGIRNLHLRDIRPANGHESVTIPLTFDSAPKDSREA